MNILHYVSLGIGYAGILIIFWGIVFAFGGLVRLEYRHLRGEIICRQRDDLRHDLGSYLLLGLEFLVAADIVNTIIRPSLNDLAVLGAIVLIRTVLNFFLTREITGRGYCTHDQ